MDRCNNFRLLWNFRGQGSPAHKDVQHKSNASSLSWQPLWFARSVDCHLGSTVRGYPYFLYIFRRRVIWARARTSRRVHQGGKTKIPYRNTQPNINLMRASGQRFRRWKKKNWIPRRERDLINEACMNESLRAGPTHSFRWSAGRLMDQVNGPSTPDMSSPRTPPLTSKQNPTRTTFACNVCFKESNFHPISTITDQHVYHTFVSSGSLGHVSIGRTPSSWKQTVH